nr:ribonuclease H-like domain-containing protein [Tanacetum cinerariifolium]
FQKILSQLNQMQEKPDNDDVNMKFLMALPPSWSQVSLTLKTRGGLEYLSFDDLYNKLRSLEIDVKGRSSYGSRAKNKTKKGEQVYGLMAGFKSDFEDHAGNAAGSVYDAAAAEFAMMGISPKSSESETYDFASCVSSPKTNDSFSTVDVKILPKYDVKDPSPTNGFPSCSFKENVKPPRNLCNKSGITDRIHCKNNFVRTKTCFVCGSKSHLIKDCDVYDNVENFPSVVLNAASILAGSRNSSASISAGRSIHAASRNRTASIHVGTHIPAGRFNKPAPFPAGRSVPTGWTNHAARPFFRPTNLYFDNVSWPRIYDHVSMNEGRWGSAVKSSAELASPEQTATDQMLLFHDPPVFGVPAGFLIPAGFWLLPFGCLLLFLFMLLEYRYNPRAYQ